MANVYVYSGAGGSANGSSWANAYTTLAAAFSAKAAGDDFWVAHDHAETGTGAVTITGKGTMTNPCRVMCVNRSGSVPPVAADLRTTATITGGTTSGNLAFSGWGLKIYYYGISFIAGSGASASSILTSNSASFIVFDTCVFRLNTTNSGQSISLNTTRLLWRNTQAVFGHANQLVSSQAGTTLAWDNTSSIQAVSGTSPTVLLSFTSADITLSGLDLSALGSGNSVVNLDNLVGRCVAENCRLGASSTLTSGTLAGTKAVAIGVNCASGSTNYTYEKVTLSGAITHEATIKRTGGASDGTTGISRKLVSTTSCKAMSPLEMDPIVVWNELTSSITVTVHIVTDNVTLTDAEMWIEVEELGTSGYPLSVIQSDRAATVLTTGSNQTTSTEAWTTTGLTTPVYQQLSVTFTPAMKGPIKVRVMLAKASTTVYVCPKVEVS